MSLLPLLVSEIRSRGPLTVAEFMELALNHPEHGYYAVAAQRSGRAGDFFTSVDVGPLFGGMLALQFAQMWDILRARGAEAFDIVEAGAGNGRLARDVMDRAARDFPEFYRCIRLTLVERSAAARAAQAATLAPHMARVEALGTTLPPRITGVIFANELLDAFPVHVVTRTAEGLREILVGERDGALLESLAPITRPAISEYLRDADITIRVGARIEVPLAASAWVGAAAAALREGFLLLVDYGQEACDLHSDAHPAGTLTTYRSHRAGGGEWLTDPGTRDLTSHVDLTAVRRTAERCGLVTLGLVDQTYFLLSLGLAEELETGHDRPAIRQRLAARTLIMPGGLGSTMKAMMFGKNVGAPQLRGTASGRLTW
jgi:SAM-dependent MidA family methyltransferase